LRVVGCGIGSDLQREPEASPCRPSFSKSGEGRLAGATFAPVFQVASPIMWWMSRRRIARSGRSRWPVRYL